MKAPRPGRRRGWRLLAVALVGAAQPAAALAAEGAYPQVRRLMSERSAERQRAARELLGKAVDRALVAPLVDALFFTSKAARGEIVRVLRAATGADLGRDYYDWVEFLGAHPELSPGTGYLEWKRELLARIDPAYRKILYPGAPHRIRLEEIVWGGVRLDGIPSLDDPAHLPAAEASYLEADERVFGVSLRGEERAYPLRILSWNEMLNDVVGDEPVTLSFCTLCGSGILYSAATPAGGRHTFGTSGLLYRSNKLMYDRRTFSLWSNLTGEPVVGRLAASPVRLRPLPMTLTTWGEWRARHPETTVLALPLDVAARYGFDYRPGAADRARRGVSFPVWQRSDALPPKAEVFALRLGEAAKAYPVEQVLARRVVNDTLGGREIVLVAEPESGAIRVYERGLHTFVPQQEGIADEAGRTWRLTEESLVPPPVPGVALEPLPRLPGHVAFWFGWYAFFPQTELYRDPGP